MAIIKAINIYEDLFRPISLRNGNYFYQMQGIYEEQAYNDFLALAASKACDSEEQIVLTALPLPVPTDRLLIDSILEQLPTMTIGQYQNDDLSLAALPETNTALLKALDIVIPYAISREHFSNDHIRDNFIVKLLIWVNQCAQGWTISRLKAPKFICYGSLKKHEVYFLMALAIAGVDVVQLSPQADHVLEAVDGEQLAQIVSSDREGVLLPLAERIEKGVAIERVTTSAKRATQELEEILYQGTGIFRPWQFAEGTTNPILLEAAYEDLSAYWNEPARLRTGFKTTSQTVSVPVFFVKLNGVHHDHHTYFQLVQTLRQSKYHYFTQTTHIARLPEDQQAIFSLAFCLKADKTIDREALKSHKLYKPMLPYRDSMQKFILDKLDELFTAYDDNYFLFPLTDKERVLLMAAVFTADQKLLQLIEVYDFPSDIPKLIFYLNSREIFEAVDALLVGLLHLMGLDIIILSPNGGNNIELSIAKQFINTVQLEEFVQDLPLDETAAVDRGNGKKSLLQRLFSLK